MMMNGTTPAVATAPHHHPYLNRVGALLRTLCAENIPMQWVLEQESECNWFVVNATIIELWHTNRTHHLHCSTAISTRRESYASLSNESNLWLHLLSYSLYDILFVLVGTSNSMMVETHATWKKNPRGRIRIQLVLESPWATTWSTWKEMWLLVGWKVVGPIATWKEMGLRLTFGCQIHRYLRKYASWSLLEDSSQALLLNHASTFRPKDDNSWYTCLSV